MESGNLIPAFATSHQTLESNIELQMQMMSWDMFMQVYTNESIFGDASSLDTTLLDNDNQLGDGGFALPSQSSPFKHQPGVDEMGNTSFDEFLQDAALLNSKLPFPLECQSMEKARRVTNEISYSGMLNRKEDMLTRGFEATNGIGALIKRKRTDASSSSSSSSSSRKKTQHFKDHPVKKNHHRLSEKVTVLQKLVSPYGKADTASVLQEAFLYIKLVQEQIKELFHVFLRSYDLAKTINSQGIQGEEEVQKNLRSKGLCLVPSSFSQKLHKKS